MTIGPEPMTSIFLISVLLGMVIFLHKRSELIEQIGTVLRAGRTFGMVLHAEHFGCLVPYALYRVIQQIDVRDLQPRVLKALFVYGIAVVLRGDLNFPCFQIFNRVISAAVAELQFICLGTAGQANHLVPQTDAEYWIFAPQFFNKVDHWDHILGVARAVGQENAVRLHPFDLGSGGVIGHDRHVATARI